MNQFFIVLFSWILTPKEFNRSKQFLLKGHEMFVHSENREELTLKTKFQSVDFLDSLSTRTLHCLVLLCLVIFFSRKYFSIMNFLAESFNYFASHHSLLSNAFIGFDILSSRICLEYQQIAHILAKLINKNQINDTQFLHFKQEWTTVLA